MTQKEEVPQTEPAEIEQLMEQVKQSNLEQSAVDKIERLLRLILRLVELLQYKNVSLKRLRTMVFGPRTEKRKTSDRHQEGEKKEETARRAFPKGSLCIRIFDELCAFGWLAHSRNSRLRLFTEDTLLF